MINLVFAIFKPVYVYCTSAIQACTYLPRKSIEKEVEVVESFKTTANAGHRRRAIRCNSRTFRTFPNSDA